MQQDSLAHLPPNYALQPPTMTDNVRVAYMKDITIQPHTTAQTHILRCRDNPCLFLDFKKLCFMQSAPRRGLASSGIFNAQLIYYKAYVFTNEGLRSHHVSCTWVQCCQTGHVCLLVPQGFSVIHPSPWLSGEKHGT